MKRILVFKDRLGFIDHPLSKGMSLSITMEDGTVLEPEREIEVPEVSEDQWKKWQTEDKDKVLKDLEETK